MFDMAAANGATQVEGVCGLFGVMGGGCRVWHGSSGHTIGGVIVDCGLLGVRSVEEEGRRALNI